MSLSRLPPALPLLLLALATSLAARPAAEPQDDDDSVSDDDDSASDALSASAALHPSHSLIASVTVQGVGGESVAIPVIGLRAETTYSPTAVTADGRRSGPLSVTAGSLPEDIPGLQVDVFDAASVTPGVTVFGVGAAPGPGSEPLGGPYLIGVDEEGEVVWYLDDCGHCTPRTA